MVSVAKKKIIPGMRKDPSLKGYGGEGCHFHPRKMLVGDATDHPPNLKATIEGGVLPFSFGGRLLIVDISSNWPSAGGFQAFGGFKP